MATFVLIGPGRAGLALALGLVGAGHRPAGVLGRHPQRAASAARRLDTAQLDWAAELPAADLMILAVRDDAIEEVAQRLAERASAVTSAIHLSGLRTVTALDPLARTGLATGILHPLQTLPTAEAGAAALSGSWMAVTAADGGLRELLEDLVRSLGARPFTLEDSQRPVYHAAAASASNYVLAALALAARLFDAAGVPFEASRPLVEAVTENAFALGPAAALTGPIARGDVGTVRSQLAAVEQAAPELLADFLAFGRATARLAGTEADFEELSW